ncbi:MAG: tRNA (guanosine(46)-N7)-methyltransferase TrmB [Gammaproteobacteria bacterium]|nr:tRNA (guanosine(46)-N7)-methyltransferase TrmB [Gammaproteobacteria bacterium]
MLAQVLHEAHHRQVRSFVRREGRTTAAQLRALDSCLPRFEIAAAGPLNFDLVFGRRAPLYLEIGSGNGECTKAFAERYPENNYLAIEVHRPGLGHLLNLAIDAKLTNLRVALRDVYTVLPQLAPESVTGIYVFFPDPWPKTRHQKRRLLQNQFFAELRTILHRHGRLYLATDSASYAAHLDELIPNLNDWENLSGTGLHAPRLKARPPTKFETRGLAAQHLIRDYVLARRAHPTAAEASNLFTSANLNAARS